MGVQSESLKTVVQPVVRFGFNKKNKLIKKKVLGNTEFLSTKWNLTCQMEHFSNFLDSFYLFIW